MKEDVAFKFIFSVKSVAPAALFLAAKVEEQPRKLEHVIKVAHTCLHPQEALPDTRSEVSNGIPVKHIQCSTSEGGERTNPGSASPLCFIGSRVLYSFVGILSEQ